MALVIDRTTSPLDADLPALRRATPAGLRRLARRLAARVGLWTPHLRFAHGSRYYVRIGATPDYEAWLLTWLPGQSTGLHDHGPSSGAFAVVSGALAERTLSPAATATASSRRASTVTRTLTAGRVRAFGAGHVHDVANVSAEAAVSLHVYSPALESMRRFVLHDSGQVRVVAEERAGEDW